MDVKTTCEVCGDAAGGYNYGVLTCNSCKMFFQRKMMKPLELHCKADNACFIMKRKALASIGNKKIGVKNCPACRFKKCKEVGMRLPRSHGIMGIANEKDAKLKLIDFLVHQNKTRNMLFTTKHVYEDVGLEDLVLKRKHLKFKRRDVTKKLRPMDWCYMHSVISINFFNSLQFFGEMESNDKIILSKNFHLRASKIFYVLDALTAKRDIIITPDNQELYPTLILGFPMISHDFFLNIRYKLLNQFSEFNVTTEEALLLMVIFFCDPGLDGLSSSAVLTLHEKKDEYGTVLFEYCRLKYPKVAPSRYWELLSLCQLIRTSQEEINHLLNMFQLHVPEYHVQELLLTYL